MCTQQFPVKIIGTARKPILRVMLHKWDSIDAYLMHSYNATCNTIRNKIPDIVLLRTHRTNCINQNVK